MAWKNFNIKNLSIFILSCFLCIMLIFFSTSFLFFPNHIQFKDKNNKINFSIHSNKKYNKLDYIEVNSLINGNNVDKTNKSSNLTKTNILDTHLNTSSISTIDKEVIPLGMTVGVCINTEGIMVLGLGYVNGEDEQAHKPSEGILQPGDLIIKANGKRLIKKEDLIEVIEESNSNINLIIKRDNDIIETNVVPIKSFEEKVNKIGIWVRDSTQGIGTITYYNPITNKFGALGHGILDVDTKKIMSVNDGEIMESEIVSIQKGEKGSPGELVGNIEKKNIIGKIKTNTKFGLYGYLDPKNFKNINKQSIPIGLQSDIHEGPAKILSNIEGSSVKDYDIIIESINKFSSDDSKGMIIKITDKELLSKTNGIVQGMSGSPIIQSGKLVGAVTHVFVQDPTKGYGIFIENMLKQDKNI